MCLVVRWQIPSSLAWVRDYLQQLRILWSVDAGQLVRIWQSDQVSITAATYLLCTRDLVG